MLVLATNDISKADRALFDDYEAAVLALLENHGAKLVGRLRTADCYSEVQLLYFPDAEALGAFRADPTRIGFKIPGFKVGVASALSEVVRLS